MSSRHTVEHRIGSGAVERYIIFAGYEHETCGGSADMVDSVKSLQEAQGFVDTVMQEPPKTFFDYDWVQVLDTNTGNYSEYEKIVRA